MHYETKIRVNEVENEKTFPNVILFFTFKKNNQYFFIAKIKYLRMTQ